MGGTRPPSLPRVVPPPSPPLSPPPTPAPLLAGTDAIGSLAAMPTTALLDRLATPAQWACDTGLAVGDGRLLERSLPYPLPPAATISAFRQSLIADGYFALGPPPSPPAAASWSTRTKAVGALVDELRAAGLPAQFALLYEETWRVADDVARVLAPMHAASAGGGSSAEGGGSSAEGGGSSAKGGCSSAEGGTKGGAQGSESDVAHPELLRGLHDFFLFDVAPGGSGWGAHRDRAGAGSVARGFRASDGMPRYLTCWVALTDASPTTSCMYVLPAHADPGYGEEEAAGGEAAVAEEAAAGLGLGVVLASRHQHIRALPVGQGAVLGWSHRLLHWGSASPPDAPARRQALSFALATPSFEPPALQLPEGTVAPPLPSRLALIAFTLVGYSHMQPLSRALRRVLLAILCEHIGCLDDRALLSERNEFARNVLGLAHDVEAEHEQGLEGGELLQEERRAVRILCDYLEGALERLGGAVYRADE